jgi:hypothetical protein
MTTTRDTGRRWLRRAVVALLLAAAVSAGAGWVYDRRGGSALRRASSSDAAERMDAAAELAGKAGDAAREQLVALVRDRSAGVALCAIRSLGSRQTSANRDALTTLLSDGQLAPERLAEAAATLGKFKSADPKPLVTKLNGHKDARVRAGAAKGLSRLRNPKAIACGTPRPFPRWSRRSATGTRASASGRSRPFTR